MRWKVMGVMRPQLQGSLLKQSEEKTGRQGLENGGKGNWQRKQPTEQLS